MKLISCNNCGLVLDQDKIEFPDIETEDGIDTDNAEWDGDEFIPIIPCQICGESIRKG